jgi:hypothetical protein
MRYVPAGALAAALVLILPEASFAAGQAPRPPARQTAAEQPRRAAPASVDANWGETAGRLYQVLQQYPPTLGQVLRLDPTLLTNQAYLEPYPALAAFLDEHPEIAHNPGVFLGQVRDYGLHDQSTDPKMATIRMMEDTLAGLAVLTGFLMVLGTIAWLLRTVIEHRRWLRVSKTHADTHSKLLDRLTSNEDLLAYMQSTAGRRFLEAAPIPLGAGPRSLSAPVGRILWSVQAGCVLAFAGGGLMYASRRFGIDPSFASIELPVFLMGATAFAIGVGFVVSAVIAYVLSRRLGLVAVRPAEPDFEANHVSS